MTGDRNNDNSDNDMGEERPAYGAALVSLFLSAISTGFYLVSVFLSYDSSLEMERIVIRLRVVSMLIVILALVVAICAAASKETIKYLKILALVIAVLLTCYHGYELLGAVLFSMVH